MSRYDVVVVGAGLAGLMTACQLARANKKVLLVASGVGALLLASGCVDVLGYTPAAAQTPVQNPQAALPDFIDNQPGHPYHFTGSQNLALGLDMFQQVVNQGDLTYKGTLDHNWLLPTPAGAVHPTCLAPTSLANGTLERGGKMLIVGFKELRDFYPTLISQNLNAQDVGVQATPLNIALPVPLTGKMNITPIELATAFEQSNFRQRLIKAVAASAKGYSRIGFPAVLGFEAACGGSD